MNIPLATFRHVPIVPANALVFCLWVLVASPSLLKGDKKKEKKRRKKKHSALVSKHTTEKTYSDSVTRNCYSGQMTSISSSTNDKPPFFPVASLLDLTSITFRHCTHPLRTTNQLSRANSNSRILFCFKPVSTGNDSNQLVNGLDRTNGVQLMIDDVSMILDTTIIKKKTLEKVDLNSIETSIELQLGCKRVFSSETDSLNYWCSQKSHRIDETERQINRASSRSSVSWLPWWLGIYGC